MTFLAGLDLAPPALAAHAPALVVAAPLIAACAAALAPGARTAWGIAVGASAFAFWMALALGVQVAEEGVVDYAMGGFEPPAGIALRVDALSAFFVLLITGMAVLTALHSGASLQAEVRRDKHPLMQAGMLVCVAGLSGLALTGDVFNAFVFLEISSIGVYAMIAIGGARDRRALPAAFNYLILGTIGATLYLIGVGFLYAAAGTLNMADLAVRLPTLEGSPVVGAGVAFIGVGLAIKAAMFPLHLWLPAAYAHAPTMMSVFLSATATKTALYLLVRILTSVAEVEWDAVGRMVLWVIAPMAALGAVVCSIQAAAAGEIRRVLAYSSVAQVGYMMLGAAAGSAAALSASLFHLFNHATMKAALFMAVGAAAAGLKSQRIEDFAGAARTAPWTMTAFAIAALSLLGAPLTSGFLSKLKLFEALISGGWVWAAAALAAASLMGVFYVGRMLEPVFFRSRPADAPAIREAPLSILAPLWVLALANVWFGVDASLPVGLADAAARAVLPGGGP